MNKGWTRGQTLELPVRHKGIRCRRRRDPAAGSGGKSPGRRVFGFAGGGFSVWDFGLRLLERFYVLRNA